MKIKSKNKRNKIKIQKNKTTKKRNVFPGLMKSGCLKNDFGHPFSFFNFQIQDGNKLYVTVNKYLNFCIQRTMSFSNIFQ